MSTQIQRLTKYNPGPAEQREMIVDDALTRIGNEGLREIAASHNITTRTLNLWLLAHPDYSAKCQAITDARLLDAREQYDRDREAIQSAPDQLSLARARDTHSVSRSEMAYALMMAERRDKRYQAKPDTNLQLNATGASTIQVVFVDAHEGTPSPRLIPEERSGETPDGTGNR